MLYSSSGGWICVLSRRLTCVCCWWLISFGLVDFRTHGHPMKWCRVNSFDELLHFRVLFQQYPSELSCISRLFRHANLGNVTSQLHNMLLQLTPCRRWGNVPHEHGGFCGCWGILSCDLLSWFLSLLRLLRLFVASRQCGKGLIGPRGEGLPSFSFYSLLQIS